MTDIRTDTHDSIVDRPDERGSALLGTLLIMMMASALAAALSMNGRTETLISHNQQAAAQAQMAAEAGLNHAVEVVTTNIGQWQTNGFATVADALDALLLGPDGASGTQKTDADNFSLEGLAGWGAVTGDRIALPGTMNVEYEALIMDDDDAADEDGTALNDLNETLTVRATGYAADNTKVVLEAVINSSDLPAVVVNGDLELSGKMAITGTVGGVHANGDLLIKGKKVSVTGAITASGVYTGKLPGSSGAGQQPVPLIKASDYLDHADWIMTSAGEMTDPSGTVLCIAIEDTCKGWEFDAKKNKWENEAVPPPGTYYVQGDVEIENDLKGDDGAKATLSIIAEGSIEIKVETAVMSSDPEFLFVTDGDLKVSGEDATDGSRQLKGRKAAIVLVAVERRGDRSGRVRMSVIPDFKQTTMLAFVMQHVAPGSTVYSDGLKSFDGLQTADVRHVARTQPIRSALHRGVPSAAPLADRAIGNLQQWLIGTHHGVSKAQLQVYLDEFVFRHNRRRQPMAAFQTLLGLGAGRAPTPYRRIRSAQDVRPQVDRNI